MKSLVSAAIASLGMLACATPRAAQPAPVPLPDWWVAHVDFMSRDGGNWLAPNPAGATDPDIPDAWGMEWRAVNDGHGLVGRLYGVEAGRETKEYWNYREFWHPGERRAYLHQWGGPGVYGVGESTSPARGRSETDQTFWLPDGRTWREGHRNEEHGDVYITNAYDIGADGQWTASNSNTWHRQPASGNPPSSPAQSRRSGAAGSREAASSGAR